MELTIERLRENFSANKDKIVLDGNGGGHYTREDGCYCVVGAMLPDDVRPKYEDELNNITIDDLELPVSDDLLAFLMNVQRSFDLERFLEVDRLLEENGFEKLGV